MIPTEATPQIVDWILIIGAIVGMHLVLAESPIRKSNTNAKVYIFLNISTFFIKKLHFILLLSIIE